MVVEADPSLYADLLRFKPDSWSLNGWANAAGVSRAVWSDMRRHGNPSRRTLERLLAAAGSSLAEYEALRIGLAPPQPVADAMSGLSEHDAASWRGAPLPPVPLFATTMAPEWDGEGSQVEAIAIDRARIIDRLARPPALAGDADAYAVAVVGDAMWPRFRPGRRLLLSSSAPAATRSPRPMAFTC